MDGSEVTVVVVGQKGVGKSTFISHCIGLPLQDIGPSQHEKIAVCGRNINIKIVDNPSRHQLVPATVAIVLFDLTNEETFRHLHEMLELAQRVSPTALCAVVGTKADLQAQRRVHSEEAAVFCRSYHDGIPSVPYYETALDPSESIFLAFQEILARPLINEFVIRANMEQELVTFVHEMMEWSIQNNSANILGHLRDLGYAVPPELVNRYQNQLREYLFTEYPLRVVPKFAHLELTEPEVSFDEFSMDEWEMEPLKVIDSRPTLEVSKTFHLFWKDIGLTCFPPSFLDQTPLPVDLITHIDLSCNYLTSVPVQFFQLPNLELLNIAHNQITSLPRIELWNTKSKLQILNASHNAIFAESQSPVLYRKRGNSSQPFKYLWYIDLGYNKLTCFPQWVVHLPALKHLNIQHNPKIRRLPVDLYQMKQLQSFVTEGLELVDPPPIVTRWGPSALKRYLHFKKSSFVPWSSLRVIVVGPKGAGKTLLVSKLCSDTWINPTPTKGLEVVEWKYKGGDYFTFRNRWLTFDLWDFTGDPEYQCIYSCFNCQKSLHLVVCNAQSEKVELIRWLSDVQSASKERIPVIVVFTHMDGFKTREARDDFRRRVTHWLEYNNKRFDPGNGAFSLLATMSQSVKSLQGDEMFSSYDPPPQEAFDMQQMCEDVVPLMPFVIKVHFVNRMTGEGISNLKKTLYRVACGGVPLLSDFQGFQLIGREIPTVFAQVEQLIRNMRNRFRSSRREGEHRPLYTVSQLMDMLQRPLKELEIGEEDFKSALKLLHEFGFVCLYQCRKMDTVLVGIDPQLIGYLLQRMIRASLVTQEFNNNSCYLPNSHLFMLWGVEPIWSVEQDTNSLHSQHFLDYLYHLDICTCLVPGITVIPAILPPSLPKRLKPNTILLLPRRVYILGYLPTLFCLQLTTRILSALVKTGNSSPVLISPSHTPPSMSVPVELPSGLQLYLWQKNIFLQDTDGARMWVHVSEGKQVAGESLPFCGRIDISMEAELEKEAVWLRLVTQEIDYLLEHVYPALLDAEQTPQQVEIFVPLDLECTSVADDEPSSPTAAEETTTEHVHSLHSSQQQQLQQQHNGAFSQSAQHNPGFLPATNIAGSPPNLEQQSDHSSWEVLSKQSSTSTRLSLIHDTPSNYCLVPLWECIQEAFKAPMIRVNIATNTNKLVLAKVIPDLLFADLPPELLYRAKATPADQLFEEQFVPPSRAVSGLFVRPYYTSEQDDICVRKPAGALKSFCLKQYLEKARQDLTTLQQLQCPCVVSAIGINFCPPSIALEAAPLGSLRDLLQSKKTIEREMVHQISLQLLNALEYFHTKGMDYHSLNSDNVLLWTLDPVTIKLSDKGITHVPHTCELCVYLNSFTDREAQWSAALRLDFIMLGLLVYEMATGHRPYEKVIPLDTVALALLNNKLSLNIEAELRIQREKGEDISISGCHRFCMQSTMQLCVHSKHVNANLLGARFSLCAGNNEYSPMRLAVNVECMLCSEDADLVYWASGSRGLVTGTIDPITGTLNSNVLQETPTPASGPFAHRPSRPAPIAVGRATALALVQETRQLWVGTENGLMGSVYVFNLPEMRRHHYIHLQDAVLSLCALNEFGSKFGEEQMKYRVLVGLANGTIILFLGVHQGKVLENPLQGPKWVVITHGRKPCLSMNLTMPDGHIWCSCGDTMEVLDMESLRSVRRLSTHTAHSEEKTRTVAKGDVITLMAVSPRGVWTVGRRSSILRLWNPVSGQLKASYNIRNVLRSDQDDVTALVVQGGVVWLGTRTGYILVLNASQMEDGGTPLLGLQYCGEGRVRSIVPLMPKRGVISKLQVVCSLEYPDEISGAMLTWEYQPRQSWRTREPPKVNHHRSVPNSPSRDYQCCSRGVRVPELGD